MICPRGNRAKYIKMISLRLTDDVNHEPRGNSSNNNNNMYMQCIFHGDDDVAAVSPGVGTS